MNTPDFVNNVTDKVQNSTDIYEDRKCVEKSARKSLKTMINNLQVSLLLSKETYFSIQERMPYGSNKDKARLGRADLCENCLLGYRW